METNTDKQMNIKRHTHTHTHTPRDPRGPSYPASPWGPGGGEQHSLPGGPGLPEKPGRPEGRNAEKFHTLSQSICCKEEWNTQQKESEKQQIECNKMITKT